MAVRRRAALIQFLVVVLLLVAGCGGQASAPHRASSHVETRPPAVVDAGAREADSAPPPVDPVLEARVAEADALFDWRNTFFQQPQAVPKKARPILEKGPFPGNTMASAKAYAFGFAHTLGCGDSVPFAANGTLCPNVVAPGTALTAEQRESVLALIREAEKNERPDRHPAVSRCDFDPHHTIVFYDEAGAPIARLLICFTCGEWLASPGVHALGGAHQGIMSAVQRRTLARLFDDLHLGAWMFDHQIAEAVTAYEARIPGRRARRLAAPSGVASEKAARDASPEERVRLCTWIAETRWPEGHPGQGFECENGRRWNFPDRCEATLRCSAPLRVIEECTRIFLQEPADVCTTKVSVECAGVLDCLPGMEIAPSPQWLAP